MSQDLYIYRKDRRWQKVSDVEVVTIDTLTAYSSEFRDIFSTTIETASDTAAGGITYNTSSTASFPGVGTLAVVGEVVSASEYSSTATPTIATNSDEVAHAALRQTLLSRSFWKFDKGAAAVPRYLYAEYLQGDQILDNPPETV